MSAIRIRQARGEQRAARQAARAAGPASGSSSRNRNILEYYDDYDGGYSVRGGSTADRYY